MDIGHKEATSWANKVLSESLYYLANYLTLANYSGVEKFYNVRTKHLPTMFAVTGTFDLFTFS